MDWSKGASKPGYLSACGNTALIGRQIALWLIRLMTLFPKSVLSSLMHLVGFSLGAHAVGFAGRYFTLKTSTKIGRITGETNVLIYLLRVYMIPSNVK